MRGAPFDIVTFKGRHLLISLHWRGDIFWSHSIWGELFLAEGFLNRDQGYMSSLLKINVSFILQIQILCSSFVNEFIYIERKWFKYGITVPQYRHVDEWVKDNIMQPIFYLMKLYRNVYLICCQYFMHFSCSFLQLKFPPTLTFYIFHHTNWFFS